MPESVLKIKSWAPVRKILGFAIDRDIPPFVEPEWSMPVLDLGPGNKKVIEGAVTFDWPEWDLDGHDGKLQRPLPYEDSSVGGVYAFHVLEHLADPVPLLNEVSRVLAPSCPFTIFVPHAQSLMFLQDLDHKTPFVIDTWKNHLRNPYYSKSRGGGDFEIGMNILFGLKEENLGIFTQLIKKSGAAK